MTIEVETGDNQFCLRLTVIKIPRNLCGEHELVECSQPRYENLPVGTEVDEGCRERQSFESHDLQGTFNGSRNREILLRQPPPSGGGSVSDSDEAM